MAECTRSSQKSTTSNGSVSSMSSILKILLSAFSMMKQPADTLPPPLVMIGSKLRPGLSARDMASRVISRFSESDAISGEIFLHHRKRDIELPPKRSRKTDWTKDPHKDQLIETYASIVEKFNNKPDYELFLKKRDDI